MFEEDIHLSSPLGGGIISLASGGETNAFIDNLPATVVASGWTLVNSIKSSYTFDILAMVAGSGFYSQIALIDGIAFAVFNPIDGDTDNSGSLNYAWAGGPFTEIDFAAAHGDHDGNIDSLANAITANTTFDAVRVPPVSPFDGRILLTSKLDGALGNGHDVRGSGHTIGVTQLNGGGWHYRSKAATGVSQFDLVWFQNVFGSLSLTPILNGNARSVSYEFFAVTRYMHVVGPHQFTIFALQDHSPPSLGDTAGSHGGGYAFMICAPWTPSNLSFSYCAFSAPIIRDALQWQSRMQIAVNTSYFYGNFTTSEETGMAFNGPYGYEGKDIFSSNGRPVLFTPLVGLAVADLVERKLVGSIWDAFLTPALFPLETTGILDSGLHMAVISNTDGQRTTLFMRLPDGFIFNQ